MYSYSEVTVFRVYASSTLCHHLVEMFCHYIRIHHIFRTFPGLPERSGQRLEGGGRRKEEAGRRKEGGGSRKEEGGAGTIRLIKMWEDVERCKLHNRKTPASTQMENKMRFSY